jgi:hypothetical protein
MPSIRKLRIVAALVCAAVTLGATVATAQVHDHLKCYKVKDAASPPATVNLTPADPMFPSNTGCTVKLKSKQICFPVKLDVVAGGGQIPVSGEDLDNPFICYAVKCPTTALPASVQMSDEFGTRTLTGLRTSTVCAPAVVGVPVTTTLPGTPVQCADATVPTCDGTCGNPDSACIENAGACICQGQEPFSQCGLLAGPPNCYGTCSGSQSCIDVRGACQCSNVYQ